MVEPPATETSVMDKHKGFTHLGAEHPDQAPRYGLLYLTVIPFFAAVGFVARLGWDWPALVLTMLAVALVGGSWCSAGRLAVPANASAETRRPLTTAMLAPRRWTLRSG